MVEGGASITGGAVIVGCRRKRAARRRGVMVGTIVSALLARRKRGARRRRGVMVGSLSSRCRGTGNGAGDGAGDPITA